MNETMNEVAKELLDLVADGSSDTPVAYNLRVDGTCAGRQSGEHIHIDSKKDKPGLEIHIDSGTKGERVSIPACVTHGDFDDLVYNDFFVGEDADVTIVAGCGVHTETGEPARHNGIHRFFLAPRAHVRYLEKHVGTGKGTGLRSIDPVTEATLEEDAYLEMDTSQIGGVDRTKRITRATLNARARLVVHERILTEGEEQAATDFTVDLNGAGCGVDLLSRSVARDHSHQEYASVITGNAPCSGHSACDAILVGQGTVDATPRLHAHHQDATLIHEAAIGKIAGEQIIKLRTLGLDEEEAEAAIIEGFLG